MNGYSSTSINDILDADGTSKGAFYNHYATKKDLFIKILSEAQRISRERILLGMKEIDDPIGKIQLRLANSRDRYLRDVENFPGGCILVGLRMRS